MHKKTLSVLAIVLVAGFVWTGWLISGGDASPALAGTSQACSFQGQLDGAQQVPAVDTAGTGQFVAWYDDQSGTLHYKLVVANLANPAAARLHLGRPTDTGPVIALVGGPFVPGGGVSHGVLADGTLTAANLMGPLAGESMADLVQLLLAGRVYVNVLTNDGVAPTGTGVGDLASGEIRAQIQPLGTDCE